ncbi:MAG: GldM family protein [Bacteroidota bacterium]|nr:GldM family protein [Bacteroidota bacterium]
MPLLRRGGWVAFAFFPICLFAQKDSIRIIKVIASMQEVSVLPNVNVLYIGMKQRFVITNSIGKISNISMEGAKATRYLSGRNDSEWVIEGLNNAIFANMHIYGTNSKGENVLLLNKKYIVRPVPKPLIKINDVIPDSVAEKLNLMAYGHLSATFPADDIFRGGVVEFAMVLNNNTKFDTLYAKGAVFTKEMKTAISKLKTGSLITCIKIRYLLIPTNQILNAPDIRIYMNATKVMRFGG